MLTSQLGLRWSAGGGGVAARNQPAPALGSPALPRLNFPRRGRESSRNRGVSACFGFGRSPNWIQLVRGPSSSLSPLLPSQPEVGPEKLGPSRSFRMSEGIPTQTRVRELPPA